MLREWNLKNEIQIKQNLGLKIWYVQKAVIFLFLLQLDKQRNWGVSQWK